MSKKIVIKKVSSVESYGQITDEELSMWSEEYEPENYNPTQNIETKDETITVRLTKAEKEKLATYLKSKGLRRSNFIRNIILKSLNNDNSLENMQKEVHEIYSILKTNNKIKNL